MTSLPEPLRVEGATVRCEIYDHGAQVVSWCPAEHDEVLWLSGSSRFDSGTAIRGGIPICFPWFGSGRTGASTPSHGFARLATWRLADVADDGEAITITHALSASPETRGSFPHDFHAVQTVRCGHQLEVHFSVENTGGESFSYEAALHTYLRVGDVRQVAIRGLDGVEYVDQVDGGAIKTQHGDVLFTAETDRIYRAGAGVDVVDPVLGRTIHVRMARTADTVVWNPWIDRAAALPDVDDDAWPTMVCVEGANVREHAIVLEPGEAHTMGYQLSLS